MYCSVLYCTAVVFPFALFGVIMKLNMISRTEQLVHVLLRQSVKTLRIRALGHVRRLITLQDDA